MKNKKLVVSILAGILIFSLLFGLLVQLLPTHAHAASSSEIKNQISNMEQEKKENEKQLAELKKKQSANLSEMKNLVNEKHNLEQQASLLHSQIDLINEQVSAYSVLIADKQEELDNAQRRLEALDKKNKERIRAMEEDGALSYWSVLFQASSFADLLDRLDMIQEIAASDRRRLKEMRETAELIAQAQADLLVEREELKKSKVELDVKQTELNKKKQQKADILQQLSARSDEYYALMAERKDEIDDIEKEIADAKVDLKEAERQEYLEWLSTLTKPSTVRPGGSAVDKDGITWLVPCNYTRVASPFGMRMHPIYHEWRLHAGVDLAAYCPTPIIASRSGVVVISKYSRTAGNYVTIDHLDGYRSVYMHMCRLPDVKVGDVVTAGQVIGCVGSTGSSTNDHLHFGIMKNGKYVDPMPYITN